MSETGPAFIFDLDGTLVDSVYAHVIAWQRALRAHDITFPNWRIHRLIGISGDLLTRTVLHEAGHAVTAETVQALQHSHTEEYQAFSGAVAPLPGAAALLNHLDEIGVAWAIATSAKQANAARVLANLGVRDDAVIVTSDQVAMGKPAPDLFQAALARAELPAASSFVVGDSVWDMLAARRAGLLGLGVATGGFGEAELLRAGAYQVFRDPGDLRARLHEMGVVGG